MEERPDIFNISTAGIFDSSTKIKSNDDFVREISPVIQSILRTRFPGSAPRQRIKVYRDRLNFACPICGDSTTSDYKKRGNILLDGNFAYTYKCHNCGAFMPLQRFFNRFKQSVSLDTIDYIATHSSDRHTDNGSRQAAVNMLFDTEEIDKWAIDREDLKSKCGLSECNMSNYGNYYLKSRRQFLFDKFLYQPKYNLLFVLNTTASGKIIGFQVKHLEKGYSGPKYKTYKLSLIYDMFFSTKIRIPEEIEALSMIFNILTIDYNRPMIAVEGPMDSFLLKNAVAMCGANKHMPVDLDFLYMFDDDNTGRKNSLKYLNEGKKVFMWSKLKKDMMLPARKKWDVNDLMLYCYEKNIRMPDIYSYFTNDEFDLLEI